MQKFVKSFSAKCVFTGNGNFNVARNWKKSQTQEVKPIHKMSQRPENPLRYVCTSFYCYIIRSLAVFPSFRIRRLRTLWRGIRRRPLLWVGCQLRRSLPPYNSIRRQSLPPQHQQLRHHYRRRRRRRRQRRRRRHRLRLRLATQRRVSK